MPDVLKGLTDDQIIEFIQGDIDSATTIQDTLASKRQEIYKRYRGEPYGNEREGFSKSIAHVIYSNHKWMMANLMEIFNEDFFILKGDDEDRSAKLQKLIYYQMFRMQDGFRRFYDFLWNADLYHYAVFKVWKKDDITLENDKYDHLTQQEMTEILADPAIEVTKYDEVENDDGTFHYENVKIVRKIVNFSGPCFEAIPVSDFYYSSDCKITDWGGIEGRLVYHESKTTLNDIRKKEKAGIYRKGTFARVRDMGENTSPDPVDKVEFLFNADDVPNFDTEAPYDDPKNLLNREVTIKECYCRLDIDGDGLLEPVIMDICGDVVCRIEENPYGKPCFRIGSTNPEPHKVMGLSTAELLDNDQKVATNLLRLIQDSAAIDCYKNPVTNDQNMFQMLQTRKPFAVIKGNPQNLGEVKTSPPSQFILKAYELLKAENEEKTGITRYNQGMDASSLNKTATGIGAIFSASAKPMRLVARLIGNGAVLGLIRDFIFINQKWPPEEDIRILGTDIVVNRDDMTGQHGIEIDIGVSAAEKQSMANQLDLLVQFGTQAGIQLGIMRREHILVAQKKKYKLLGLNVDDCFVSLEQIQQEDAMKQMMQKQMMQQQAQQAQAMAQNGPPQGQSPSGPIPLRPGREGVPQMPPVPPGPFEGTDKILRGMGMPLPDQMVNIE